jgi:hypothetical protein
MKKILSAVCMALLVACSGNGVGGPPPTPNPSPSPSSCSAAVRPATRPHSPHIMRPLGASFAASGEKVSYGGGPVLVSPKVFLVLWGYGVDDPVAKAFNKLYPNVGGSSWLSTVTQYCESPGVYITNPTGLFGGVWSDMDNPLPLQPTQNEIEAEAMRAAAYFKADDIANDTIVVATASGHSEQGFGQQFCGWHDYTSNGLSYEYIPYMPDQGSNCGADSVNGKNGELDGLTIVAGHELAEAMTDPQPYSGWVDRSNNEEVADLCEWSDLQDVSLNGVSLPMQPIFSNSTGQCEQ